jgi:hypothetical protein
MISVGLSESNVEGKVDSTVDLPDAFLSVTLPTVAFSLFFAQYLFHYILLLVVGANLFVYCIRPPENR